MEGNQQKKKTKQKTHTLTVYSSPFVDRSRRV